MRWRRHVGLPTSLACIFVTDKMPGCLAVKHVHHIDTTVMNVTQYLRTQSRHSPPVWFFQSDFDEDGYSTVDSSTTPCVGFWPLEKNPTTIPTGIVVAPTHRVDYINLFQWDPLAEAPLFTWQQVFGDFTCIIQASTRRCRILAYLW